MAKRNAMDVVGINKKTEQIFRRSVKGLYTLASHPSPAQQPKARNRRGLTAAEENVMSAIRQIMLAAPLFPFSYIYNYTLSRQ